MHTTDAAVKEIITTQLNTLPFIRTACVLLDTQLGDSVVPAATRERMECYLAAHLVAIREPRVTRRQLGETEVAYQAPKLGEGLKSTLYGQTVLDLDPTGKLETAVGLKPVQIWVD